MLDDYNSTDMSYEFDQHCLYTSDHAYDSDLFDLAFSIEKETIATGNDNAIFLHSDDEESTFFPSARPFFCNPQTEFLLAETKYLEIRHNFEVSVEDRREAYRKYRSHRYRQMIRPRLVFKKKKVTVLKLQRYASTRQRVRGRFVTNKSIDD